MTDPAGSDPAAPQDDDLAELFEHAPCGYVVTAPDGRILAANVEFARLVGRRVDSIVGSTALSSFLTTGGRIFLETHLLPMLEHDGVVREIDLDLVGPDGRRTPVLMNANRTDHGAAMRAVFLETRDRHRYEDDLREATRAAEAAKKASAALAQTLQQSFIPPLPPTIPFLAVAAAYRPAGDGTTVGGDFYDIFQTGPDSWVVALGDVSGKGPVAATVTSFVRYTLRALTMQHDDPAEAMTHLDRLLHAHRTEHYCTVVLVRLRRVAGTVTMDLCLAGHPPALVRSRDGATAEFGAYGSPVGLVESPSFATASMTLTDEVVVLHTDGITEARGPDGLFGEDRLRRLVVDSAHEPSQIAESVVQAALRYQDGRTSDDIAIVTFSARHALDRAVAGPTR